MFESLDDDGAVFGADFEVIVEVVGVIKVT